MDAWQNPNAKPKSYRRVASGGTDLARLNCRETIGRPLASPQESPEVAGNLRVGPVSEEGVGRTSLKLRIFHLIRATTSGGRPVWQVRWS